MKAGNLSRNFNCIDFRNGVQVFFTLSTVICIEGSLLTGSTPNPSGGAGVAIHILWISKLTFIDIGAGRKVVGNALAIRIYQCWGVLNIEEVSAINQVVLIPKKFY